MEISEGIVSIRAIDTERHWHCAFVIQYRKIITIPNLLPLQDDKPSGAKGQIIGIF